MAPRAVLEAAVLPVWLVLAVLVASVGVLIFHGIALWLAAQMPRLDPAPPGTAPRRSTVSVIVAARNEEVDLPNCLDGLLAQDAPAEELIAVNDGSTDHTRAIADARSPKVRVLDAPILPAGWVGKNWACDVGYRASTGSWLLFTDADMRYHPSTLRTSLAWADREGADLVTLAPRVEMTGFWEKVVLPFYVQATLTYFRTPRVNRDRSSAAMANGQYLLARRSAYEAVGGHAQVRGAFIEDVRLAQEFRRHGFRMRVGWAPELLTTRMYRARHELYEGILKTVHGTRFSAARQVGFLAALVGLFWLPLVLLPVGIATGTLPWSVMGATLWFALFGKHVVFTRAARGPGAYGLLFPLAVGFYVVAVGESLVRGVGRRRWPWKGRWYPVET